MLLPQAERGASHRTVARLALLLTALGLLSGPSAAHRVQDPPDVGGGDDAADSAVEIVGGDLLCVGGELQLTALAALEGGDFAWSILAGADRAAIAADGDMATVHGTACSGEVEDVEIEVRVTFPDGSSGEATRRVTVIDVDLVLRRPPALDASESALPEALEESVGGQTWENLDNDDAGGTYDAQDGPLASAVDDDLARLELVVWPAGEMDGSAVLRVVEGLSYVAFWADPYKEVPLLGDPELQLEELEAAGDGSMRRTIWLEGVGACVQQREVLLELSTSVSTEDAGTDAARYTVLGAGGIRFEGKKNGYTEDGKNDSDDLDARPDVQLEGDSIGVQRVFPGARVPDTGVPRDRVEVEVEIAPAPVEDVILFLRPFDQDDPSSEWAFIDPNDCSDTLGFYQVNGLTYDPHNDNRGNAGGFAEGKLIGSGVDGVLALLFPKDVAVRTAELQVGHQPGDNYRLACSPDRPFLRRLENIDWLDLIHIVDPETDGRAPIPKWERYTSNVLEVWRILHVEWDSMARPSPEDNRAEGFVQSWIEEDRVFGISSGALKVNGEDASSLDDGSKDESDGEKGRFERGKLSVESLDWTFESIVSNGPLSFTMKSDLLKLTAEIVDADGDGYVLAGVKSFQLAPLAIGTRISLYLDEELVPGAYAGGTISIGDFFETELDFALSILANDADSVLTEVAEIPFHAYDDDTFWLLPDKPNVLVGDCVRRQQLSAIYAPAYIDVVQDGGGMGQAVQKIDIPVEVNIDDEVNVYDVHHESEENAGSVFWVAYLLSAYQCETTLDNDPDEEDAYAGVCHDEVAVVFHETTSDAADLLGMALHQYVLEVAAHEIGHLFALEHYEEPDFPKNLMGTGESSTDLLPEVIDILRCRIDDPRQ